MKKIEITHYFTDAVWANGYLWFFDWEINAFIKFNSLTLKCEYIWSVPNEVDNIGRLYLGIVKCGDNIVLCPNRAKSIAIYDIVNTTMTQIEIEFDRYSWMVAAMYGGWVTEDNIYFFRRGYCEIYRLNMQTKKMDMLNVIQKEDKLDVGEYVWHYKTKQIGTHVILYDRIHLTMYQFEKETHEVKVLLHLERAKELVDFDSDGHFIWILYRDGMIYKFDKDKIVDRYDCNTDITDSLSLYYYDNTCFIIDQKNGQYFSEYEIKNKVKKSISLLPDKKGYFFSLVVNDDKIFYQEKGGKFYYSDERNAISAIAKSDLKDIPLEAMYPRNESFENSEFSIMYLLKQAEIYNYKKKQNKEKQYVMRGTQIYNYLK